MGAGEEFLNSYLEMKEQAIALQEEIKELHAAAMMPGKELDGMPHGTEKRDLSSYVARLAELEDEYTAQWVNAKRVRGEIVKLITLLFRGKQRELFVNRYIVDMDAKQNAKLPRVSLAHYYRLWKAGLQTVERHFAEEARKKRWKLDENGPAVL